MAIYVKTFIANVSKAHELDVKVNTNSVIYTSDNYLVYLLHVAIHQAIFLF
jgi:hypothetical protein